jgi:carbamoyltransferase
MAFAPRGFNAFFSAMPVWVKDKIFQKRTIIRHLESIIGPYVKWEERLLFSDHHLSHSSSAFFPSPFNESAVLTMDGVGEWATCTLGIGSGNQLEIVKEINFPHSLGLLYSAFTYFCGFKVNSGEYKLMGLAPFGDPIYVDTIKDNIIDIKEDGSFRLDMSYFNYCVGLTMTSKRFDGLFGGPPRLSESKITQREMDIAASIQKVTEEVVIRLARSIKRETGLSNLCIAGGVALNCVANGKLLDEKIFENIWIQPASGDAGGSLGAALAVHYIMLDNPRITDEHNDTMKGSFLGPSYTNSSIEKILVENDAKYIYLAEEKLIDVTAKCISEGFAVGWMNGSMEFGPRALGARSILADPRSPGMQKQLNLKVKFRESFRPFAPCILLDDLSDWFEMDVASPYMLLVTKIKESRKISCDKDSNSAVGFDRLDIAKSEVPSVTHVDYSSRIQTIDQATNPLLHKLLTRFKEITGCPMLINTSFNIRGEPIVNTPLDAYHCFLGTDLDVLVIGNYLLYKECQKVNALADYRLRYALD